MLTVADELIVAMMFLWRKCLQHNLPDRRKI